MARLFIDGKPLVFETMPFSVSLANKSQGDGTSKTYAEVTGGTVMIGSTTYIEIPDMLSTDAEPLEVTEPGYVWLTVYRYNSGEVFYKYEILPTRPGTKVDCSKESQDE